MSYAPPYPLLGPAPPADAPSPAQTGSSSYLSVVWRPKSRNIRSRARQNVRSDAHGRNIGRQQGAREGLARGQRPEEELSMPRMAPSAALSFSRLASLRFTL